MHSTGRAQTILRPADKGAPGHPAPSDFKELPSAKHYAKFWQHLRRIAGGRIGKPWHIVIPLHRYREALVVQAVRDGLSNVICWHPYILHSKIELVLLKEGHVTYSGTSAWAFVGFRWRLRSPYLVKGLYEAPS